MLSITRNLSVSRENVLVAELCGDSLELIMRSGGVRRVKLSQVRLDALRAFGLRYESGEPPINDR